GPIALAASHGLAQFPVPFGLVAGHMLLDDGSQLVLAEVGGAAPLAHASIDATCTTSDLAGAPSCDRPLGGLAPLAALA
ncbi:MAG: acyl-CoA dehydrogenase, partial [Erythrobacter sp.]|nr:acyl-CoA dehydrogenase [Erythrobacter sp.]